ncbi:MAG: DUF4142 domain-containing protein [Syntrophales bacterium]|jgi:putative membrane protein|nr:DUF4142 domain-containing protein [Syntrophales bacterium]MDY0045122.1 DUF4142 domain-containing protein [Syntrophales bacterium]
MKKTVCAMTAICIMMAFAGIISAQQASVSAQDKKFVEEAATGSMMEVRLGEIASQKAENEEVKNFAQTMINDHGKASDELKTIAQQKGIEVPQELNKKQQKKIDTLSQLSGMEFDRAYMDEMVKDHQKDVKAFRKQAEKGRDPDLKNFAATTADTLEQHLELAKNINQEQVRGYYGDKEKKQKKTQKQDQNK